MYIHMHIHAGAYPHIIRYVHTYVCICFVFMYLVNLCACSLCSKLHYREKLNRDWVQVWIFCSSENVTRTVTELHIILLNYSLKRGHLREACHHLIVN